ncbi:MAG: NADH:flavin oxidoreductase, partial [Desulfobacterales bacterium]|nr:NADH:flavin oxidoreductase [Desulfobacterales bacterium]
MSLLFTTMEIGNVELPNRFVCSATHESTAKESGEVSETLIKKYERLAKGSVGLSITGLMYVQQSGRGYKYQTGIHDDRMMPGLKQLTGAVHQIGGKIAFQLVHCGRQTTKSMAGQTPLAPSSRGRDPINFVRPKEMTEADIRQTISAFGAAAKRAVESGADAVQLHGAHGYLICEFLSPFFNIRTDDWGGSDENRFKFLKEVFIEVKNNVPDGYPVLVKINSKDYTPKEGITPALAVTYAKWLADLGIDGIEVSCGTTLYSYMNMCRGDVPTTELVKSLSWWKKPVGRIMIGKLEGKYGLEEGYNRESAKKIKLVLG